MKAKIEISSSFSEKKILTMKFVTEILELPCLFKCSAHEIWVSHRHPFVVFSSSIKN
jgi:hypothetical protein